MARRKNGRQSARPRVPSHTARAILCVLLIAIAILLTLAPFGAAGAAGADAYTGLLYLLGLGYFIVPLLFLILGLAALREEHSGFTGVKLLGSLLFLVAGLGFVDIVSGQGGLIG
ncbi:MAG: hypothetical protein KGJ34_03095, partial [Patescibacteria group bacterium]|nr:hypothetical protein [Patescibacteria group bacterium]